MKLIADGIQQLRRFFCGLISWKIRVWCNIL